MELSAGWIRQRVIYKRTPSRFLLNEGLHVQLSEQLSTKTVDKVWDKWTSMSDNLRNHMCTFNMLPSVLMCSKHEIRDR
ncbi:hypothetical protein VR7878_03661 [Vibrio ruber DSM 16370]|uniref:Uncharacterized protein n=1 Tax=Vibrio ruber (strain DSM 16370 / JCM 11486 / BCRC 17186 / CECT 7878 / LMG 23124 / VR1) TaxID=1123498 RepID=A0A1R4LU06_VIBR1|nr:hypothetical protein VR7878_03661 [Vibrio ruber DSM 16370]